MYGYICRFCLQNNSSVNSRSDTFTTAHIQHKTRKETIVERYSFVVIRRTKNSQQGYQHYNIMSFNGKKFAASNNQQQPQQQLKQRNQEH